MLESDEEPHALNYIITHVFCPLQLPHEDDHTIGDDHALADAVCAAACAYSEHVNNANMPQWNGIIRMLENVKATMQFESLEKGQIVSQLSGMKVGDTLTFLIRAQNAAVIFRKQRNVTLCESLEVSPMAGAVMTTRGKLVCSYPGPAIEVPNGVFDDWSFQSELANFLTRMNVDVLDSAATAQKARSTVLESREPPHPRYITELLTGILRAVGRPADIIRITKRIGDDVVWNSSRLPWRRSPLWLLIRVALQTSMERSTLGRDSYKAFLLFFMCSLAEEAVQEDLPNDILHFLSTKISRRLRKLGSSTPDWLSRTTLQTCTHLRLTLDKRWTDIQVDQHLSPTWSPLQLDLARDTQLLLPRSREYLLNSLANQDTPHVEACFKSDNRARGTLQDFLSTDGAFFKKSYQTDPHTTLYDVEQSVAQDLTSWTSSITDADAASVKLEVLANMYSSSAIKTYANNPELLSIMLLTTIELWIAIDQIAVKATPFLADYSPEVPSGLLGNLLLRSWADLERARGASDYISLRHARSHNGRSVFSADVTSESFAVRYYEGSPRHQTLRAEIEEAAQRKVDKRLTKLEKENARHAALQQEAADTDHTYAINWNGREYHAKQQCHRCDMERRLAKMEIAVHEWPLPADDLRAAIVVFELDCPVSFNMWRSSTFRFLVTLCSPSPEAREPYIRLSEYDALKRYRTLHPRARISLASDTKPFVKTHYNKVSIPSTKDRVCVKNGLSFYGFDTHASIPVSEALPDIDIKHHCTYVLPNERYRNLQKYVTMTSHTSNEIIANQADCDKELSIHEFIAFGHLRSGGTLQWLNIVRELRDRTLSFRRPEVHFLLAQAACQLGPLTSTGEWMWHQELQEPSFCFSLLGELKSLAASVEANWLEAVTMSTVSLLLSRLLGSNPNEVVMERALGLLRHIRKKTFSWVIELSEKLARTPKDDDLRWLLRDMAAICRSTFDVDSTLIPFVICSQEDVEALLSCSIFIHDNTPASFSGTPVYSQLLLQRDRRLSLVLEDALRDASQDDTLENGIDLAIRRVWAGYRPGTHWQPLPYPNSRWLSCETAATNDQRSQVVHFNLLNGAMFVDGKPLSRLPDAILQHPTYCQVFGEQVLDVIPADLPGMSFSTRGLISQHRVYFALRDKDLIIQAKHENAVHIIQLIPRSTLEGDLPATLIQGHVHWLNLSTSTIEIRPVDKFWEHSTENWEIVCGAGLYRLRKGHDSLVDIHSPTWSMVSNLLKPLDAPENLIITVSPESDDSSSLQLSIDLPRYRLSFFVDEDGELQSRNLRGMVYDENQCSGAMFGLVNQLVLRPKRPVKKDLIPRRVLIPDGNVSFHKRGHHVHVEINTCPEDPLKRVTYQTYTIDVELGCLTGNVSMTNKLYRAYLHALTSSGYGTDPLTGRTGAEEALCLLRSAGCRSIMKLGLRDAELLNKIASLAPARTWYPPQMRRMQTVVWPNLSANAPYHELYIAAKAIKEHCERVQLFQPNQSDSLFEDFPEQDDHLLARGALRAAYLLPPGFASELPKAKYDVKYKARDLVEAGSGENRAYMAAYVVYNPWTNAKGVKDLQSMMESWKTTIHGEASLSLQYSKSWLEPDLPSIWIETYRVLRNGERVDNFDLLFSLPAMAYGSPNLSELVPTFMAFMAYPQFLFENPPPYPSYSLSDGYRPLPKTLLNHLYASIRPFEESPEMATEAKPGERERALKQRQLEMYNSRLKSDIKRESNRLTQHWPSEMPPSCSLNSDMYDVEVLAAKLQAVFSTCYHNHRLKEHLVRVQKILDSVYSQGGPIPSSQYVVKPCSDVPPRISWELTENQLFVRLAPSLPPRGTLPRSTANVPKASGLGPEALHTLMAEVQKKAANSFHHQYVSDLRTSAEHLDKDLLLPSMARRLTTKRPDMELKMHYSQCRVSFLEALLRIKEKLGPRCTSERALAQSGQWPRMTAYALFQCLASTSSIVLSEDWKTCLINLALLALDLQRSRRLLRLNLENLEEEFAKELENEGCDGWDAEQHLDWLLIQLQGNILIRRVQVDVALEMISPRSGENTAMQLNMGEGKSSVIVPSVATALADGDQIVRIIVPKALTTQMFQLLLDRLGGLVNRRIYYLPFSRSLEVNQQQVTVISQILSECMRERGILVLQPEHVLSFRLVSVEKQLSGAQDSNLARQLLDLQRWLHSHTRDILDESDEILHVRYQLVYTIGHQQPIEGFPERWTTTQQILSLVKQHARSLRDDFPFGVEFESGPPGSFPHFRILQSEVDQVLIGRIVRDLMAGRLLNINFGQLPSRLRDELIHFISCKDPLPKAAQTVKDHFKHSTLWSGLLLLRGLLATGILLYPFKERRWRVDYGLAPKRTMLAVPYRAKDVPAQRAEFGHPDVAIILTCLSYYYGGLSEDQLKVSFDILLKQDDPSSNYELWVRGCLSAPDFLRNLSGVNTKSSHQWNTYLFPLFSHNKATVDFYLSKIVFPKEAKEFPSKLSCSGWDLAEKRDRLLTGFSGTNDGRYLLPIHVTQCDPDHQRGTNARVLAYLLQPENNSYMLTAHKSGERRTTREFLQMVVSQDPEIRVLLDIGAQMLDLQNQELAKTWLDLKPDASAAIFFNEDDELAVVARDGTAQLLLSSPFAQQLDQCVVYLDDAHTRGTDIKFPRGFRAAVTLGPKVTKDRLVQGCMRMRDLGFGHSAMFFAPLEVDWSIRALAGKGTSHVITTPDILHWAIRETCNDIQQQAPHWAQQGIDHTSRYAIWSEFCRDSLTPDQLSSGWLRSEAKSLVELYSPHTPSHSNTTSLDVPEIQERCLSLGISSLPNIGINEEQEREVVHEVEPEPHVQRPPRVSPAVHRIEQDVVSFVRTGIIPPGSRVFRPIFQTLYSTSATWNEARVWGTAVLATRDFSKTVVSSTGRMDDYLRPVQWVLSRKEKKVRKQILVVLSPYEVDGLMHDIKLSKAVHLHLYTPRTTKSMRPCDDLMLYSTPTVSLDWALPSALIDQLSVFAGQLYLTDYSAYTRLCRFLCIHSQDLSDKNCLKIDHDGFIAPEHRPRNLQDVNTFRYSPLPALRALMNLRRKGMSFSPTHIGRILDGRLLSEREFDGGDDLSLCYGFCDASVGFWEKISDRVGGT